MAIVTWLHLSDWHQGGGDFDRKIVADTLLDDIKRRETFGSDLAQIDILFFTGDLAYRGVKAEFEKARDLLLEPVRQALGLEKDRLFLIPGNHDLDRNRFKLLPTDLRRPFANSAEANEWMHGEEERAELLKPFAAYQKFIEEYGPAGFGAFGDFRQVGVKGKQIGIVGCNSALMCGRHKDSNDEINDDRFLTVGEPQVFDALRAVKGTDVRIGLIHHPFGWLTEEDRGIVRKRMQQECNFLLRGHVHEQAVEITKGTQGDCVIILGGTCYNGRIPERPQFINAYNFVSYNTDTGQGTVYLRRWSLTNTGWTADTDSGTDGKYIFTVHSTASLPKPPRKKKTQNPP